MRKKVTWCSDARLRRLVIQAEVDKDAVIPQHAYFPRLACNKVAIKRIPADVAFRDSYHAKQVYREICLLKQVRAPCASSWPCARPTLAARSHGCSSTTRTSSSLWTYSSRPRATSSSSPKPWSQVFSFPIAG
jgi:hypothetical protein